MARCSILDVRDQRLIKLINQNPWSNVDKDIMIADYLTIKEFHEKVREGQITKDEFFTAVDELICF